MSGATNSVFCRTHLQQKGSVEVEEIDVESRVVITAEVEVFLREEHGILSTRVVHKQILLHRLSSYTQTSTHSNKSQIHARYFTEVQLFYDYEQCGLGNGSIKNLVYIQYAA